MGRLKTLREMVGVEELKTGALYKALAAEFLGTLVLVMMACGVGYSANDIRVPFTVGLTLATLILALGHVSGCHVNPAVTMAFLTSRYMPLVRSLLYMAAQVVGGIAGAAILYGIMPEDFRESMGTLQINEKMTEAQAFGMELMLTFTFVFTVLSATDERRTDIKGSVPLSVGLVLVANISFGMSLSGACMNPARALAPAILVGTESAWSGQWVYWVGPFAGGVVASLIHTVFREKKDIALVSMNGLNHMSSSQQHIITRLDGI